MNITFKNVSKSYCDNKIYENLNVSFHSGEITSITSPNGSGKTTLINMLLNLVNIDDGQVEISENIQKKDFFILYGGDRGLYLKNTVEENIKLVSILKGVSKKTLEQNIIKFDKKIIDYENIKHKVCKKLSHGQKRLVEIFMSVVMESKVIILDELTEGLDLNHKENIGEILNEIKKDRIILVCSHDYEFIEQISDKVYFIVEKNLVLQDNLNLRKKFIEIYGRIK